MCDEVAMPAATSNTLSTAAIVSYRQGMTGPRTKTRPMTGYLRIAQTVLHCSDRPMSCTEILDEARRLRISLTNGGTPSATLHSLINRHIHRWGDQALFYKSARGRYGLTAQGHQF
ncbi:MAG: HTH domain-containing protein [Allosphingosinicella sp.]